MADFEYTLTGLRAVAAKLHDEVQQIFFGKADIDDKLSDWRLEYYIMQTMCSDACYAWELKRNTIVRIVNAAQNDYCANFTPAQINTAFRRLTRAKFLYGKTTDGTRHYGVNLKRYD